MPWALVVHGDFINDSGKEYIEESNFEGARLKKKYFYVFNRVLKKASDIKDFFNFF